MDPRLLLGCFVANADRRDDRPFLSFRGTGDFSGIERRLYIEGDFEIDSADRISGDLDLGLGALLRLTQLAGFIADDVEVTAGGDLVIDFNTGAYLQVYGPAWSLEEI